jgi:GntR family mannosyl-D-glycerate transport/metabolism transcriptional repressor
MIAQVREHCAMADHSALPPWRQLAQRLRDDITSGRYGPGDRLPSAVTLHQEYGVAVVTARKALRLLVEEGLAYTVEGMGTYVAEGPVPGMIET